MRLGPMVRRVREVCSGGRHGRRHRGGRNSWASCGGGWLWVRRYWALTRNGGLHGPILGSIKILARRLVLGKGYDKLAETDESRKKINKFKESAWKFVYFLSGELLSLSVTYNEPWFKNTRYFWVGPREQFWPDQKIKLKLKAVETRRSDFGVSMSHHVVTVVLIVLSYIFRFACVGSVVLALHDTSDIFLEIGKMAKYRSCEWLAVVAFLHFVASWILLRLIIFPFWILRGRGRKEKGGGEKETQPQADQEFVGYSADCAQQTMERPILEPHFHRRVQRMFGTFIEAHLPAF